MFRLGKKPERFPIRATPKEHKVVGQAWSRSSLQNNTIFSIGWVIQILRSSTKVKRLQVEKRGKKGGQIRDLV